MCEAISSNLRLYVIGDPEGKVREKVVEEIMTKKNVLNLIKTINPHTQETQKKTQTKET